MNHNKLPAVFAARGKMKTSDSMIASAAARRSAIAMLCSVALLACAGALQAATLYIPNSSFESPVLPPVSPYAGPEVDFWQKSPQPAWYDPSQNFDTPWPYLMGTFYNVPFPDKFIDNCAGSQAAFLFALPEAGLFQDYRSFSGTNTTPSHAFNAAFATGKAYTLTVGVIGGGGGMKPGATLQLSLYYRDANSNRVTVASTSITNNALNLPTNTHFVDFQLHVSTIKAGDAWVGQNIGIEIASTVGFELSGGYWDVDNVRLVEEIDVPNGSFESPVVPPVSPYAGPEMDFWQKSPQPAWYDPSQNFDTPWPYLMGTFYNVPFPDKFIDNCDGRQAAFLFALPEAGLFQDYSSFSGTNTTPSHEFNAAFTTGKAYTLTVGVMGGGGGMKPGATLQLSLYYRDANSNRVTVASTSITNNALNFPTNTHLVDYEVQVSGVKASDPWAGKNIGIQLLSTTGFDLAGGYWDLDNIHLTETVAPVMSDLRMADNEFTFTLLSEPGWRFDIEASTNLTAEGGSWTSIATFTNTTGGDSFTDTASNHEKRYYRTRKL
jgi:hypothetical protein